MNTYHDTAIYTAEGNFVGHSGRECADHRTAGARAWCGDCHQWCSEDAPCARCELPVLRALAKAHEPTPVPLDEHRTLVDRWRHAKRQAGSARATVDTAEAKLLDMLADGQAGTIDGVPVVVRDTEERTGIDLAAFRESMPDLWRYLHEHFPALRSRTRLKQPRRNNNSHSGRHA